MKIYTKTGDKGETSLFGGKRVWKDDLRISAYGSVDELNAVIGVALTEIGNVELRRILISLQSDLFVLGSDLATPLDKGNTNFVIPRIQKENFERLEKLIDETEAKLPELKNFILPGGTKGSANLQLARTICRRAERDVVALSKKEEINSAAEIYLNRLSDLLFVLARYHNFVSDTKEINWQK
ncbi:MAG: Cob(I)alamin adenosyltransferase [Ignavibacteria bacterium]|nr:MAG: Cob(I)alamin adenosyltransferase [Ignavibacteria bacterium]KAF0160985.1 MAG: Cob(I)alamin adenosyltransferase [Ignavibacteria bacterium]